MPLTQLLSTPVSGLLVAYGGGGLCYPVCGISNCCTSSGLSSSRSLTTSGSLPSTAFFQIISFKNLQRIIGIFYYLVHHQLFTCYHQQSATPGSKMSPAVRHIHGHSTTMGAARIARQSSPLIAVRIAPIVLFSRCSCCPEVLWLLALSHYDTGLCEL